MGLNGCCRGIVVLAMAAALIAPGATAETPQAVTVDSTVIENNWQPAGTADAYAELGYAETTDDWTAAASPAPVAEAPDTSYWVAEGTGADPAATVVAADAQSGSKLGIDVSLDWVSKYMFRGFDVHDDSGAFQPSVELSLGDCGLTLGWWASYSSHDRGHTLSYIYPDDIPDAVKGGEVQPIGRISRRDLDEHNYYASYSCSPVDGIDMELGWIYYDFIHLDSTYDYHEPYGVLTLSCLPLSPYFGAYYGFPKHDSVGGEGWNTTLGVSHSKDLCQSFCGQGPISLDLAADVWYNGGQYNVDTGWSHATFGGALNIPLSEKLTFSPGLYYQLSMEDTINEEDEWWTTLSLAYSW